MTFSGSPPNAEMYFWIQRKASRSGWDDHQTLRNAAEGEGQYYVRSCKPRFATPASFTSLPPKKPNTMRVFSARMCCEQGSITYRSTYNDS